MAMSDQSFDGKRARFPAYDDELGVKLHSESTKDKFEGGINLITDFRLDEKTVFEREISRPTKRRPVHTDDKPKRELAKHRQNLPDYGPIGSDLKKPRSLFEEVPEKNDHKLRFKPEQKNLAQFEPTYVPASLIPDEPEDKISQRELLNSMLKDPENYILLAEDREVPNQPSIKKNQIRKGGRLDRSLRGILQEDSDAVENTKYFKE